MSGQECEVKTIQLTSPLPHPLKNMKKITCHKTSFITFSGVLFPDGKTKVITCSRNRELQIFDLESEKCEKIIKHSTGIHSVHFYDEEQLLMTTNWNGELEFWDLFSPEIKVIKKIKITEPDSRLWRLTQVSEDLFFCCVGHCYSSAQGSLFSIRLKKDIEFSFDVEVEEIKYPLNSLMKEALYCIHKLISEKNTIIFSGGDYLKGDNTIKKYNFVTKKHFRFPKIPSRRVFCLTSFIGEKNEEIILSGSGDETMVFWDLKNNCINFKEIKLGGDVICFLNDFKRKNIFVATGFNDYSLYSLNIETKKLVKNVEKIHTDWISCIKWINVENQNIFVTCSDDYSFNIFELVNLQCEYENIDFEERINYLREEEFFEKVCSSKNMNEMFFSIKVLNSIRIKRILRILLV